MDANDASSPGSLSSPPHSPEGTPTSTVQVSSAGVGVGPANVSTPTHANATSPTPRGLTVSGQPRKKPGPKPKPKDPSTAEPEKKTRKPRKPAEPKDPSTAPVRKRRGKASMEAQAAQPVQVVDEKPIIQDSPTPQPKSAESVLAPPQPEHSPAIPQAPRVLNNQEPTLYSNPNLSHMNVAPSTPRPSSSGQRYDPIRGGIMEDKPQIPASAPPPISPPLNRASASPSITSLIDPPSASNSFFPQPVKLQQQASVTSAPQSPASFHARPGPVLPSQDYSAPPQHHQQQPQQLTPQPLPYSAPPTGPSPMEIDSDVPKAPAVSAPKTTATSNGMPANHNAPTPPTKPARQKEAPPPLPTGSGLLSGTPFGPVTNGTNGTTDAPSAPNIYLTFDLKGRQNTTINVALEIEKRYGFAALHPRIAARQERQRQMKAAGAALERAAGCVSTDDMSVDLSDNESNVEMGGMDDNASATENGGKKRRKRKQEDYDKEDDFIDDTELAWEQQALMAKDGFFVYSGPLVTEEKPAVERADGTVRRGRGRGRGGTTRGETSGRGRARGGGPGSRGGSTVRKPRVTKADRAAMEQEKLAREKMGEAIAKQPVTATAGAAGSV
ncbi:HPC2-domain-containing protein [Lizonia empirigonia]|nr:HPC2-domain-containing protein [Lizonia empirigonia]